MSRLARVCALLAVSLAFIAATSWSTGAEPTSVDPSADGSTLFHAKGCASCHDGPGSTATIGGFPSLRDARAWAAGRRPGLSAAEYLTESIVEPSAFRSPAFAWPGGPTDAMPELVLGPEEVAALVDHLLAS